MKKYSFFRRKFNKCEADVSFLGQYIMRAYITCLENNRSIGQDFILFYSFHIFQTHILAVIMLMQHSMYGKRKLKLLATFRTFGA